jgi:hypothetical protein
LQNRKSRLSAGLSSRIQPELAIGLLAGHALAVRILLLLAGLLAPALLLAGLLARILVLLTLTRFLVRVTLVLIGHSGSSLVE